MLRTILSCVTLIFFLIYSQGSLVMWVLYHFEKHDIILYYCAPTSTDGRGFIHKLTDNSPLEHGANLIKMTERVVLIFTYTAAYLQSTVSYINHRLPTDTPHPSSHITSPQSPPPRA